MKIKALALALVLTATPVFAADVDGKWTGSIDTPNGPVAVTYSFMAEGEKLNGSTTGPDGTAIAIMDGKVVGNKVSFWLSLDFGGGPTKFIYTGVVSGSDCKLHTEFQGMPIDIALKKT